MAICLTHTDREATTKCATCVKPLCAECAATFEGNDFCSDECRLNFASSKQRVADAAEKSAASAKIMRKKKMVRMITSLIVIIAVVAGAILIHRARPDLLDKLKRLGRRAKTTIAE